jgi:C-terminal processing protease CtpA/Prc/Tol biopolymer transport system component
MKKVALLLFAGCFAHANAQMVIRQPAISPDATQIAFSYQGDIWMGNVDGSNLRRLTIHEAYESNPVFNTTGDQLAFSGNRYGSNDVYTIPTRGGAPKRLTYHSANDVPTSWSKDGTVYFSTNRLFAQVEWDGEVYTISEEGGTPQRMLNAVGEQAVLSPNGKRLAYVRGACRMEREAYRGPADTELWLYDLEKGVHTQLTQNDGNDVLPRWADDNTLYYISSDEHKVYNIARLSVSQEGGQVAPTMVTSFKDNGVYHFDIAQNTLIMERLDGLYKQVGAGTAQKMELSILADYRFDPIEKKTYSNNIGEYQVSPNGKNVVMVIHGEVFVKAIDEEKEQAVNISNHAYREGDAVWVNDSVVLFTSDRDGAYNIYAVQSADTKKPNLAESLKHRLTQITKGMKDISRLTVSPNLKKLAYLEDGQKLMVANLSAEGKLSGEKTLFTHWDGASNLAWSPDSRYLAYDQSDLNFNSEVYILAADGSGEPVNVSMHPRGDYGPVWSEDGSKIGFVSNRNNGDADVWFAWLTREDWLKTQEDREEGYYFEAPKEEEKKEEPKEEKKKKEKEVKPVVIDFPNIHDRLQQVTSLPGNESSILISRDGETFYFTAQSLVSDKRDLYKIKWDGSDIDQLTSGGKGLYGLSLAPGGDDLYAINAGVLNKVDSKKGSTTRFGHKAKMMIDREAERTQVFDEAWKALSQRFYDPDFHGKNWQALHDTYRPYALAASTSQDFRFVFNNMLGQLNASHMGIYGGNPEKVAYESTGKLGIEVMPRDKGVEVMKVLKNGPADRENSRLSVGDVILEVGGSEVTKATNFYALLNDQTENKVLLKVKGKEGTRELVIRPSKSVSTELYEDWVDTRKALVDKYSNGRLGYIHIKGMDKPSFERFERELQASGFGKEGIVIDVRFNGGGWTTDYLMAVLNVKQHAYTIPRGAAQSLEKEQKNFTQYYPYSERLPLSAWVKPSIAMCNESSYSNAEIFSHAYKTLGIGTLVGMPTFGAVISTGGMGLLDGSFVRIPFRGWYVKATDQNMENGPAVPDIMLENAPDSKAKGEDPQLKKAVDTLLEQLKKQP